MTKPTSLTTTGIEIRTELIRDAEADAEAEKSMIRAAARFLNRYRRDPKRAAFSIAVNGDGALRFLWPIASLYPIGSRGEINAARFPILLRPTDFPLSVSFGGGGGSAFG